MAPRKNVTYSSRPNHAARAAHAKGDKMFRTYDTSAIRPRRSPVPAVLGVVVLVAVLGLVIFGVTQLVQGCSKPAPVPNGQEVEFVVNDGEAAKTVGKRLYEAGLISNANDFVDRVNALGNDATIHPGTYKLVGGQSVDEIIAVLQTPVKPDSFTVPEGSTVAQTADIVAEATGNSITADDFKKAASDASVYASSYPFLEEVGNGSLEGFLFPKTYPIDGNATADSVIRLMLDQYSSETANIDWSYAEASGLSHYQVLKMASIIEKEADTSNRATVASVFYNRLAAGMNLQSDATVAYFVGHDPTPEDIATESPYNTYLVSGLNIPTPINSPSLDCIKAACSPERTNYLYFYFEPGEDGKPKYTFSESYDDHQAAYGVVPNQGDEGSGQEG